MANPGPPNSNLPPSMGPGARPLQSGERPESLLTEITQIRSNYNVHLASDSLELAYELHGMKRNYRLPFDNIPIYGWTKSLCYGGPSTARVTGTLLIDMIRASENLTGRRITQEEAEGMAFYTSRRMMTMYLGQVAGLGIGFAAAWRGRKEMKFPFVKPKDAERYQSFPLRRLPLLQGNYARLMWQITRGNIYAALWLFVTNPLFRSVADTRMTVGLYRDSRTHDLVEQMKGQFDRLRSNRANQAAPRSSTPATQAQQPVDDASPAAFDDAQQYNSQSSYSGDNSFTDANADTDVISDTGVEQRQTRQASPNAWSKAQSRATKPPREQQDSVAPSSDYFFDDASPTAGNDPGMEQPRTNARQTSAGGSTWDRLRRSGGKPSSTSTRGNTGERYVSSQQSQDFATSSESFSYSPHEEERRLAKQQAQKEFDAMLDKERKESGSAEYARDMQATEAGAESNAGNENAWSRRRRS